MSRWPGMLLGLPRTYEAWRQLVSGSPDGLRMCCCLANPPHTGQCPSLRPRRLRPPLLRDSSTTAAVTKRDKQRQQQQQENKWQQWIGGDGSFGVVIDDCGGGGRPQAPRRSPNPTKSPA